MNKLQVCDELKAKLDGLRPFPIETIQSLKEYYRVGLSYTSNAIEGNSLTESETKIVIEEGLSVHGKPLKDIYEAVGHADAFTQLKSLALNKKIELQDILQLHSVC